MKNRIISMLLLVCMVICALSGCKEPEPSTPEYKVSLSEEELALKIGDDHRLTATVTPESEELSIMWKSSNPSVASVSKGRVVGISEGSAVIEAVLSEGNSARCTVTVLPVDEDEEEPEEDEEDKDDDDQSGDNAGDQGDNSGNTGVITTPPYSGGPVTITFYHAMGSSQKTVLDDAIARFNELYPNITIDHSSYGSYDNLDYTVKTKIMVGAQPNLTLTYPEYIASYNAAGVAVSLDAYMYSSADAIMGDKTKASVGLSESELESLSFIYEGQVYDEVGTTYSLPLFKSTEVMYYNKTFFDEHSITVPTTWEEMEVLCEYIAENHPKYLPFTYDSESNFFITLAHQSGSSIVSFNEDNPICFDNSTNMDIMKMLRRWYDNGYFATQNLLGSYSSSVFVSGGSLMSIASINGASYYATDDFEVGVAPVPQVDSNNPKYISHSYSACMLKNENEQANIATWLFMKFLATDVEFQTAMSMTSGCAPVNSEVINNKEYVDFLQSGTVNLKALALNTVVYQYEPESYISLAQLQGLDEMHSLLSDLFLNCILRSTSDIDALITTEFANTKEEILNEIS